MIDRKPVDKVSVTLDGVPETLLYTLHNRACETLRSKSRFRDPDARKIYESIDFDFVGRFGRAIGSSANRSIRYDHILSHWIEMHPEGLVVSLGEGLETQSRRLDNGKIRWLTIDLPEAMAARELFLKPTERFRHLSQSALDFSWMQGVDDSRGLFIVAQGLFMYLESKDVRGLLREIHRRFPAAEIAFDFSSRWLSRATIKGLYLSKHYRFPPHIWGINHDEVEPTLREWLPKLRIVKLYPYNMFSRGPLRFIHFLLQQMPVLKHKALGIAHLQF